MHVEFLSTSRSTLVGDTLQGDWQEVLHVFEAFPTVSISQG